MNIPIRKTSTQNMEEVIRLLSENNLPIDDVKSKNVQLFIYKNDQEIIGCIGIEKYVKAGLLRSMAIKDGFKGKGIGKDLLAFLISECKQDGIEHLYLLTTTADQYFKKHGFKVIQREIVPEVIKLTREFKDICPSTAVVMKRNI